MASEGSATTLRLQWHDVDLQAGVIMVRRALDEVGGKLHLMDPKTARSRRRIDLPQVVIDALRSHRKKMAASGFGKLAWVFCNRRGSPLRRRHFHKQTFKPLLKRAGLPEIRFHDRFPAVPPDQDELIVRRGSL